MGNENIQLPQLKLFHEKNVALFEPHKTEPALFYEAFCQRSLCMLLLRLSRLFLFSDI